MTSLDVNDFLALQLTQTRQYKVLSATPISRVVTDAIPITGPGPLLGFPVQDVSVEVVSLSLGTGTSAAMLSSCAAQAVSKVRACYQSYSISL